MVSSLVVPLESSAAGLFPGGRSHTAEAGALKNGQILVKPCPYSPAGGAVTAAMYLPLTQAALWAQLTRYSRWVEYFPNIIRSEVLPTPQDGVRRLYQVGRKAFLLLAAEVEVYLRVYEQTQHAIQFRLERGTFADFKADLILRDWQGGTLLTYTVQASPLIPVPSFLIEQGMQQDLPGNLEQMRRVLCR